MSNLLKVKGYSGLCRDAKTGAIINTDEESLKSFKRRKKQILDDRSRIEELEQKVKSLENRLSQIENYLKEK